MPLWRWWKTAEAEARWREPSPGGCWTPSSTDIERGGKELLYEPKKENRVSSANGESHESRRDFQRRRLSAVPGRGGVGTAGTCVYTPYFLFQADGIAAVFGVIAIYVTASITAGRERDKEAVSYSLLWGQTALTVLLAACAVLGLKQRLGL